MSPENTVNTNLSVGNHGKSASFNTTIGKYVFPLKTNVKIKYGLNFTSRETYINQQILDAKNYRHNFILDLNIKPVKFLRVVSLTNFTLFNNKVVGLNKNSGRVFTQEVNADLTLFNDLNLNYSLQNQVISGANRATNRFMLSNAGLSYRSIKLKSDFPMGMTNIFNIDTYNTLVINDTNVYFSKYRLNPRRLLLKVYFNI